MGAASQSSAGLPSDRTRFVGCIKDLGTKCRDAEREDRSQNTPTSPTKHHPDS